MVPGDPKKKILVADVRTKIRGCKELVRTIFGGYCTRYFQFACANNPFGRGDNQLY